MSKKIWNLMSVVGNPAIFDRVTSNAGNPCTRAIALEGAATIGSNCGGWRVWVEHAKTGERIFESQAEKQYAVTKADELASTNASGAEIWRDAPRS